MFSFCKETRSPISRWKVGPVATEAAAAKHKYPARKPVVLDVFFSKPVALDDLLSQNRLFMMHFSQNR